MFELFKDIEEVDSNNINMDDVLTEYRDIVSTIVGEEISKKYITNGIVNIEFLNKYSSIMCVSQKEQIIDLNNRYLELMDSITK